MTGLRVQHVNANEAVYPARASGDIVHVSNVNRAWSGHELVLGPCEQASLMYDAATDRWRVLSSVPFHEESPDGEGPEPDPAHELGRLERVLGELS